MGVAQNERVGGYPGVGLGFHVPFGDSIWGFLMFVELQPYVAGARDATGMRHGF